MAQQVQTAGSSGNQEGMSTLTKVLIVIGVLIVLAMGGCAACTVFFARMAGDMAEEMAADFEANPTKAAAEMAVRLNPELELVDSDDEAGTMTIRNARTGEEVTMDFSEIADGNFSFSTDEGEVTMSATEEGFTATGADGSTASVGGVSMDDLPQWIVSYPGADYEGGTQFSSADGNAGSFVLITDDSVDDVLAHYEEQMNAMGFAVTKQTTNTGAGGGASGVLLGRDDDSGRTLNVIVAIVDGRTQINSQFQEPAEQ